MFFELPVMEHRTRICADGPEAANPLKHHFRLRAGRFAFSRLGSALIRRARFIGLRLDSLFGAGIGYSLKRRTGRQAAEDTSELDDEAPENGAENI
ncbi:hypothetical protein AB0F71_24390 [Kitasatospora sp. NPDC028055]|uniref:hypothetical protein n=1 Tax=Kitasatospora sp. NPDC028055 TaxID=3155653 RepID=UPI0033D58CC5